MTCATNGRGRQAALALAGLLAVLLGGSLEAQDLDQTADVRAMISKWVETKRLISKERNDWTLAKENLAERSAVIRREIESLRSRIAEAKKSIADAEAKKADLVTEKAKLEEAARDISTRLRPLEERTLALLKRLPVPVVEIVKPVSQRIPADASDTKLGLSERYLSVIGIINEVEKFNRQINLTSEVRALGDGTTAEVTAMYLGIGQSYYVNGSGTAAGIGRPGPDAWVWSPSNAAAADVAAAVAMLKNEKPAEFVRLPLRIE